MFEVKRKTQKINLSFKAIFDNFLKNVSIFSVCMFILICIEYVGWRKVPIYYTFKKRKTTFLMRKTREKLLF